MEFKNFSFLGEVFSHSMTESCRMKGKFVYLYRKMPKRLEDER